ncbi:hypothetical protein CCH79_00019643, partial [Gambusia affinis]
MRTRRAQLHSSLDLSFHFFWFKNRAAESRRVHHRDSTRQNFIFCPLTAQSRQLETTFRCLKTGFNSSINSHIQHVSIGKQDHGVSGCFFSKQSLDYFHSFSFFCCESGRLENNQEDMRTRSRHADASSDLFGADQIIGPGKAPCTKPNPKVCFRSRPEDVPELPVITAPPSQNLVVLLVLKESLLLQNQEERLSTMRSAMKNMSFNRLNRLNRFSRVWWLYLNPLLYSHRWFSHFLPGAGILKSKSRVLRPLDVSLDKHTSITLLNFLLSAVKFSKTFEDKYHVFDNTVEDPGQVRGLVQKINRLVKGNGEKFYTNEMFKEAQRAKQEEEDQLIRENPEIDPEDARRQAEKDNSFIRVTLGAAAAGAATGAGVGAAIGVLGGPIGIAIGAGVGVNLGAILLFPVIPFPPTNTQLSRYPREWMDELPSSEIRVRASSFNLMAQKHWMLGLIYEYININKTNLLDPSSKTAIRTTEPISIFFRNSMSGSTSATQTSASGPVWILQNPVS